jgi:hypothetical protein
MWLIQDRSRGYEMHESTWDGPQMVHGILEPHECDYIISKAESSFARSTVVGIDGPDESRTSETAWVSKDDPVARKILERACELTGKSYENTEDLQVVRYKPGTYYRAHHDACCEETEACSLFENKGGQRVGTLLVYLNDDFTDGETHFPDCILTNSIPTTRRWPNRMPNFKKLTALPSRTRQQSLSASKVNRLKVNRLKVDRLKVNRLKVNRLHKLNSNPTTRRWSNQMPNFKRQQSFHLGLGGRAGRR